MSFTVCMKKRKRMTFVRVLCIVMILVIGFFMNLGPMREYLIEDSSYLFFMVLMAVFVLMFAYTFYVQRRPRIEVDGQDITFYPLWAPAKKVTLSEITSRRERPEFYDPRQAAAGAMGGGALAYAVAQKNAPTMPTPRAMVYTYFRGPSKLITITTREMENAERFDQMVVDKLEGRAPARGSAMADLEPAEKKKPFLSMAGSIGAVCLLAVCSVVIFFAGGNVDTPKPSGTSEPVGPEQTEPAGKMAYSTQGVTFEISADWQQIEGTELFRTADQKQAYGLNGASALGSYAPQEFFKDLVKHYQTSGQFDSLDAPGELRPARFGGVDCQVADMVGYQGKNLYCTKLVIAPQKNLVLTFCAQAHKDYVQGSGVLQQGLDSLCESLTFEIGTKDEITGNTFLCGDGSQLCLQDSGDFRWYQSAEDHEKPYYEGVYEVYYGQPAMDKVVSMTDYGLTMEELERVLAASMNGYIPGGSKPSDYFYSSGELEDNRTRYDVCLDTFYAVILHNQRLVSSPEDVREGGNSTLYIGFYLPELKMADLTNCNAASHTQWTFQEKTD